VLYPPELRARSVTTISVTRNYQQLLLFIRINPPSTLEPFSPLMVDSSEIGDAAEVAFPFSEPLVETDRATVSRVQSCVLANAQILAVFSPS
jgi:hypothetical protein